MRRTVILAFTLLSALTVQGQTRHRAVPTNPAVPAPEAFSTPTADGPWSIQITTSGGFTGNGAGRDIRVESNGTITVGQIEASGRQCQFHLSPAETQEAFRAVLNARADLWYASFLPANGALLCCDRPYVNIDLQRQERDPDGNVAQVRYLTQLLPGVARQVLPSDLLGLYNAIEQNFGKYIDQCR